MCDCITLISPVPDSDPSTAGGARDIGQVYELGRSVLAFLGVPEGSTLPHHLVFYGSWLLVPIAIWLGLVVVRSRRRVVQALSFAALGLVLLGIYARFVEPHRLVTARHDVDICAGGLPGTLRAAVVSDMHFGIFRNAVSARRIANTINRSSADLVLIPGDFTYHLTSERFSRSFAALREIRAPIISVLGNHDVESQDPLYRTALKDALDAAGVTVLDHGEAIFRHEGKFVRVIGLKDLYDVRLSGAPIGDLPPAQSAMPTIILQHNPDVVRNADLQNYDLLVAGHTHGGQVWIPQLTCRLTFACKTLRYGLAQTREGQMFVTSGTGMVGLPIRFNQPPRIDLLDLTLRRCPNDERIRTPQPERQAN